mmetsp:Transcript_19296/g.47341  ORF Transcript_19296/g.47341 Transcript_19296/m.47341 type:complete len:231 (-) Transcript_19296:153-845(-)
MEGKINQRGRDAAAELFTGNKEVMWAKARERARERAVAATFDGDLRLERTQRAKVLGGRRHNKDRRRSLNIEDEFKAMSPHVSVGASGSPKAASVSPKAASVAVRRNSTSAFMGGTEEEYRVWRESVRPTRRGTQNRVLPTQSPKAAEHRTASSDELERAASADTVSAEVHTVFNDRPATDRPGNNKRVSRSPERVHHGFSLGESIANLLHGVPKFFMPAHHPTRSVSAA